MPRLLQDWKFRRDRQHFPIGVAAFPARLDDPKIITYLAPCIGDIDGMSATKSLAAVSHQPQAVRGQGAGLGKALAARNRGGGRPSSRAAADQLQGAGRLLQRSVDPEGQVRSHVTLAGA